MVYGCLWGEDEDDADPLQGRVEAVWGDAHLVTYSRSALKPIQVLPLLVDGIADRIGMKEDELALATGSHSAQAFHMLALEALMERGEVDPEWLRCGRHRPFNKDAAREVGEEYTASHNNCSGKHAAMLAWCVATGSDTSSYLLPEHPLQRRIRTYTSLLSGVPAGEIQIGIDGCGLPTLALPLAPMARMFHLLARPESLRAAETAVALPDDEVRRLVAALHRVRDAMQHHPEMVAGDDRVDTDVIRSTGGRWVTKAGAEGLWCGVDTRGGAAFAFKCIDGNFRAVAPATLEVLAARRLLSTKERQTLDPQVVPVVRNHAGTEIGRIVPRL